MWAGLGFRSAERYTVAIARAKYVHLGVSRVAKKGLILSQQALLGVIVKALSLMIVQWHTEWD